MSLYAQGLLDTHDELVVDCFAGGGGASSGLEQAFGRMVDIAINHDPKALSMHQANHPQTLHIQSDIFDVDPRKVTDGRPVGLAWFSPDCTDHSKAKGGKPIRTTKRRSLAWVVTRWAGTVKPRVIMLENVEEFKEWSPLVGIPGKYRRCPKRKGLRFRQWVKSLRSLGYRVEWRELRSCNYGAPTIRKRLYLIARCDGQPIVWPEGSHSGLFSQMVSAEWECVGLKDAISYAASPNDRRVLRKRLDAKERKVKQLRADLHANKDHKPWRGMAECLDWSIPMLSIFATKDEARVWAYEHGYEAKQWDDDLFQVQGVPVRPLADNTMKRIARGVKRFVLDNPRPFLAPIIELEGDKERSSDIGQPVNTLDCSNRVAVVASFMAQHNGGHYMEGEKGAGRSSETPLSTICNEGSNQGLVAANLIELHGTAHAEDIEEPLQTISAGGTHHAVAATHIQRDFGMSVGSPTDSPIGAVTSGGNGKASLIASFLSKYYGEGVGQNVDDPAHTIPTVDRFGFVTVTIGKDTYFIEDIKMRMLAPKELYLAQGFRQDYIFDRGVDGKPFTKTEQVRMCGNSVSPPVAEALARANCPELIVRRQSGRAA